MSISITLYKNVSDPRVLTKNIVALYSEIPCDVIEPCDRLNPVIILDSSKVDLVDCNYMYIPEFGRYYFITSITGGRAAQKTLYAHVDVLMTYDQDIRNCPIIAARSTNIANMYLTDSERIFNSYVYNQYVQIGNLGAPDTAVVITLG